MAAAVVTFPSTGKRVDAAQALGSKWTDIGGGKASVETDFTYQGGASISEKVSNATGGISFDDSLGTPNTEDVETTPKTYVLKLLVTTTGLLNSKGASGANVEIGSGGRRIAFYQWHWAGLDTWPLTRSWLIVAVDPNLAAYRDEITGSPNLTLVDYVGFEITTTASAKAENCAVDAVDYVENGVPCLLLIRGDGGDVDAVIEDFISFDEGTEANRQGLVLTQEGIVHVIGTLGIGESGTATEFTDSNRTLIWPDGLFDTAFAGLILNLGNVGTVIAFTDFSFEGRGREEIVVWFDTALDVDGTNNELDITAHGYLTGDYVQYSDEGGTAISDLVDLDRYWVRRITDDIISLHTTRAGAFGDTAQRVLTAASAPGANHKLTKEIDTRPTIKFESTSGTGSMVGTKFNNIDEVILTTAASLTDCIMLNSTRLTVAGGTVTGLIMSQSKLDYGEHAINVDDLADIVDCFLTADSKGHLVRVTATTGSPFTWGHVVTSQWGPAGIVSGAAGWEFDSGQAFTSEVIVMSAVHDFTNGEAVFYNDQGGTVQTNLTDGSKYYVNVISTTTISLHLTRSAALADSSRINMVAGSTEQHALFAARATVLNDTGGAIVIAASGVGTPPSFRNVGNVATTDVQSSVTVTFDTIKDDTEVRVYAAGTSTELAGIENATAGSPDNRNFAVSLAAGTNVDYTLVNVAGWEIIRVEGFTWPSTAQTINIQQRLERNYSNPS